MMNEGDPPPPAQQPEPEAQPIPAAPQPEGGRAEGSASFLRAARAGDLERVLELLRAGTDINTSNANGLNSLHLASKEGHSEVVRELIKRQAQVDAATRKGNTALHIASLAGQSLIVTILVENGANVNVQSVNGFTPLYMAAQENHEDVVRYLLNHGANQALSTEDGFTPLAVALQQGHDRVVAVLLENDAKGKVRLPALHIAAKKDDTKAATLLLQNEHNPDVTSKSGFTPLHIAAHYGHENVGTLLLDKGANVNYQARHNISPLHVATKWGRINMANVLLARGAIIDSRTKDLLTPLHCAARSGHDQVVDLLVVQGAPISAKTKNGLAPLHMAAQGDHVDAARTLLYHRAPVDDVTVDYLTPLHVAAHCGHVRVAKLLLDRSADPNSRALNGFTPLHIACKKNRIKVVELLLKYRAAIEATTESGLTPLHVAAFMGAINIVIYLLQQGANPDVETVRGETPLHLAARANQTDVVRVLIRNGAKVDAQARELQTPLHIASRLGNTDIVVLLLQAGANSNATTRDHYSPLHIAAKEGQEEVVGILLDHNADKNLLTKKGFTPLHLASKYGNLQVVRLLLERGTPVDIEGKNQVTPLHVAAHYNNDKVAMLLLENGASAKASAKNGYTPLHIAAKKNQMEIASTLLQFKADPNAKSRAGFTPLHLAAQEGHKEISGLLIENGSDVGAKANNGLTPLHLCAQEDHVPVAQILVDSGSEINSKTNAGYTPLHVACHFGQLNMVRFLVEHGADVGEKTRASYTPLHQAAQQGHNNCVRYLLENGASPNEQTATGQTPLAIAQRLGYVSVVETLRTVTETTVITETTTVDERYKPQNPEAMNETMFSESEDEGQAAEHEAAAAHAKDFSDNMAETLHDSTGVHMIHTGEQLLQRSQELENGGAIPKVNSGGMSPEKEFARIAPVATSSPIAQSHSQPLGIAPRAGSISGQFQQQPLHGAGPEDNLEELVRRAQNHPIHTANYDNSGVAMLENGHADNVPIGHHVTQPSFLISFLVDARGGAMRGCRHSGVRIIVPPRKASQPIRVTCRYLRKDKLAHPPPLSEGEELASRILEMAPAGAKFLGPVILEVPHFASLRDREREIVILRSDDGQHWKEHQLEATEDAVQEVLNESFDAEDLAQLDDLQTPRITRILTSDFPMYFAVVTRVRQEVHCVGPEGGVIISSVVPRVQAIFPDGSLTKTIKVSVQAQPVPQEMVTRLHGNRVAVSPIVTVEPRRRKFHKPITLCIPLPQSNNKGMLTQYSGQQGQEPPTLRLLCSITGGSAPAQWEDITGTTQLTFTGDEVSFTTTVSARFWLMDCQTPRDAARMAQEVYNEAISIPYMAKFAVFARRTFPVEGQLRVFCMTDDKEDKTLEKQEHFKLIAKSRDVEVLKGKHQFLEFSGNLVPITKSGDQLSLFFLPFQENRLAFMVKTRSKDDTEAATEGRIGFMAEPKIRSDALPPQQPTCTLAISLPEYTGEVKATPAPKKDATPFEQRYGSALEKELPEFVHQNVLKGIGADWPRLGRALEVPHRDIQHIRHNYPGQECKNTLKIWIHLKKEDATQDNLDLALRQIGRDDIVRSIAYGEPEALINYSQADSPSQKREPIRHFEDVPAATLMKREVRTEDLVTREPIQQTHNVEQSTTVAQEPSYSAPVHHSPVPEEPEFEEEAPVAEMRTVVRTERHVHDTDSGPVVEERTITTTYEDDVAVNENIVDRTVPLNDEERQKWEELNRLADESSPSPAQRSTVVAESTSEQIPEDVEQSVESESHREDDGTIVTTTVTTSHISESPLGSPTARSEEPEERKHPDDHDEEEEASGAEQHSGQDSGTTQKKETAEEGFTNEDGSVVVSKKMTRVVTTTRTTLPGEGEEPSAPDSPVESLGSVKDRIAKFERFKTLPIDPSVAGPPPSVHAVAREDDEEPEQETREEVAQSSEGRDSGRSGHSEQSIPEVQFTESDTEIEKRDDEHHEESYIEPAVGIVITPHTPVPPEHPDDVEEVEDEQPQEPLELSEPEHVAHAEIKDTREYSDEELSHELSPSEEHVSTAEIKDIKSYSPTSSDDERASKKGKVSPPIPQVRHVISPSVASEMSSHDDELAAHFVAESFEKQDEGRVETIEQTPIYRGHHSPGQTSPIVSEHPIAQEYAESVTSHDEGDNLSLKSGHEPEIARHSVASVREEEEEKSGLGDYAKKAGMIVGGVIAAPVALAAVGAKAAYDALKKDSDDEGEQQEVHEEPEVLTTQTTIMESPIQHEDIPPPHLEDVTPKVSHHEHPHETVTETTTTVTREYYDEPESPVRESPVPSEKEPKPHVVSETVTTTTVTREYHEEEVPSESHEPAPSSHVESEHRLAETPVMSEKEHPQVVETTTTTTYVTRKHDEEDQESESPESVKEAPHVTETTTTTTVTREYDQPEEEFDSERLSEPAHSPEPIGTPAESEKSIPHVVETTTTTTVTREFYDDQEEPEHCDVSPVHAEQPFEQDEAAAAGSPIPSERSIQQPESPVAERHSSVPSEPISEKDAHHVTETTTTTTVTREYYEDEPENHSPAPSSHIESEHHIAESPAVSEKELPHVVETTTTTTVTREYEEDPETETTPAAAYEFGDDEYERPESPAEVYPIPSEKEQEPHLVSETTATTTVTREYYDEPEHEEIHAESHSPSPSSHVESERQQSPSEKEHVVETTTTTTVTREFHDDQYDRPEAPEAHSPSPYAAAGSPIPPEKDANHVTGTTTTTTVTREYYEDEQENHSPAPSSHVESEHQIAESPAVSEKEIPHTLETTTTTSVTRADDYERPESQPSQPSHRAPESPVVSERRQFQQESAVYHSQTETSQQQYQPESGDESDGERFGSKVLGFAKKAGMVAGGVVAAPVALAAVGAKAAYDALKKDSDDEGEHEQVHYESAELKKEVPSIQTHQDESEGDSEGSFVDHGEDSQRLPSQSTEAAFNLSTEDVAEQTAEKLVSEVFSPLDRTLIESEQYRASIESLNRRSPVQKKKSVEDLASEALQNVTKISFGHADESDDKHDDDQDEEWKVYDRHGEILEEFSTQLTDDVIQEAEGDATTQIMMTQAEYSPRRSKFLKQESCQEISNEPEVDYYSDLQEKLNILAGEKNNLHALVEEEPSSSASDQLDVIHESDQEAHLEKEEQLEAAAQKAQEEKEEAAEITATNLVEEVLQQVVHEIKEDDDDQRTMTSDAYLTATEKDDQEYDTCVTSQDDTYESAQGWTSQDSEYTTATSQAPSRLSDSEGEHTARDLERQETSTPQAMISPVDSDRQFTAQQDFEMPVIKAFDADDFLQTTARSTPDVALQVTIEEEDESDDKLPISPSGILLPPKHDPGRPISPVPPRKSDATMQKEGDHFVFVREEDTIAEPTPPPQQYHDDELVRKTPDETLTQITTEAVPQLEEETEMRRQETERIHSLAMEASSDLGNSESSRYSRQLSDLSSSAESHADTVIRVESERSGSSDSLEVVSVISAGKDAQTSEKSLTPEEPEKPVQEEQKEHHEDDHPHQEAEDLGFEVYDADTEEQEPQQSLEELETVEEEPEDSDSLNEGGNHSSGHSSVGVPADTLAMIGKYRHQSSDNLSLTSLQEFERLEREVGARGDGPLTRSEIELLVAGRLNKSGEGSVSSLAEFERLEKEMTENQSPPEDVMMLSDIREESEAEDMSTRGDDEEDIGGSDTELKSRPVQDEDLRVVTPVAPSPTDSLEHALDPVQMQYLETSTDSLEPTFQEIEVEQRPDSVEDTSLTEYEMVPRVMEASTTDSLDGTATIEKDSVLEGASQGIESTQSTHGLLSGDTMGTVVTDDDRDSLDGEVSSMLQSYPTTLTTFQTTVVGPDGSLQTISRRVETRVTDPLVSHVTFTGTESQERLDQLPDDEQFETVDTEGNVTRTTFHREHDQQHPQF